MDVCLAGSLAQALAQNQSNQRLLKRVGVMTRALMNQIFWQVLLYHPVMHKLAPLSEVCRYLMHPEKWAPTCRE